MADKTHCDKCKKDCNTDGLFIYNLCGKCYTLCDNCNELLYHFLCDNRDELLYHFLEGGK